MTKAVVFLDIDDTIINRIQATDDDIPVAFDENGSPVGYMTTAQRWLLETLLHNAMVVPTTGRSLETFQRVRLPFDSFRILSFGAIIIHPDGRMDEAWRYQVMEKFRASSMAIRQWYRLASMVVSDLALREIRFLRYDQEELIFIRGDIHELSRLRDVMVNYENDHELNVAVHFDGHGLMVGPKNFGKEAAVRYLMETQDSIAKATRIGMGNALTDLPFMDLCHWCVMPSQSHAWQKLRSDRGKIINGLIDGEHR